MQKLKTYSGIPFPALNCGKILSNCFTLFLTLFHFVNIGYSQSLDFDALYASDGNSNDSYGYAIDIYGDYIIVGASTKSTNLYEVGAVYIYKRGTDGTWSEIQKLLPSDPISNLNYGVSVSIYEDNLAVGAYGSSHAGPNSSGAVYLYSENDNGVWVEDTILTASDAQSFHGYGWSLDLYADKLAVAAPGDNDQVELSGAVYLYAQDINGTWNQEYKLKAASPQATGLFGHAVQLDEDNLAVVSLKSWTFYGLNIYTLDNSGDWTNEQVIVDYAQGINWGYGNAQNLAGSELVIASDFYGSAKVFEKNLNGIWEFKQEIEEPQGNGSIGFATSVCLTIDYLFISNPEKVIDGVNSGVVYQYTKDENGLWSNAVILSSAEASTGALFGNTIAASGEQLVISAPEDDLNGFVQGAVYTSSLNSITNINGLNLDQTMLYQNTPNPFSDETIISFELEEAAVAEIRITDLNGKLVRSLKQDFAKGFNSVSIRNINTFGIYITLW